MKSEEFITEAIQSIDEILDTISKIFNIDFDTMDKIQSICRQNGMKLNVIEPLLQIARDCQPFLQEVGTEDCFTLFRGMSNANRKDFITKRVRLDGRTPTAMDKSLYTNINSYFNDKYGSPFRDSLLCTGSARHTKNFGETYAIFPAGNMKFLWHENVEDLNYAISDFKMQARGKVEGSIWGNDNRDTLNKLFMNHIMKLDWHTTDLPSAIGYKSEIMIRCEQYHGIKYNAGMSHHIEPMIDIIKLGSK